jgi:anti-sigma factor RsiW
MSAAEHPDNATLADFVLGRLDSRSMTRVERHLRGCSPCAQVAIEVPDDRLVTFLRASAAGFRSESTARDAATALSPRNREPSRTSSARKSRRNGGILVLLACLAGVMAFFVLGCFSGGGPEAPPTQDKARAREAFKKRFTDYGEKSSHKSVR